MHSQGIEISSMSIRFQKVNIVLQMPVMSMCHPQILCYAIIDIDNMYSVHRHCQYLCMLYMIFQVCAHLVIKFLANFKVEHTLNRVSLAAQ